MTNIRRYYKKGQVYFITCVTYNRERILIPDIDLFWESIQSTKSKLSFEIIAWVIIPDHFHMIIDPRVFNLSDIMKRIKLSFSKKYRFERKSATGRIWQNRFWDHIIRDQKDLNKHIDYIHYNPVKHNIVKSPLKYEYSSLSEYKDFYEDDWGVKEKIEFDGDFGE
jgi:putative transposase